MNIVINKATCGYHDPDHGWRKGIVQAAVDGHRVAYRHRQGWDCYCDQDGCEHIGAVAALISPDVIDAIREGRPKK